MQKTFENWNDLIVFLIVLYVTLLYFNVLKYPNEAWRIRADALKESKNGGIYKILLVLVLVFFAVRICWSLFW